MYTLYSLVKQLVGNYSPHGDSCMDEKSVRHVEEIGDMLTKIVWDLCNNVKDCCGHHESSMLDVSRASWNVLREIRTYINDAEQYKNEYDQTNIL